MVTLDSRDVGAPLEDVSTRRYLADDGPWAVELLGRTAGRQRFRRGQVIDAANLPGVVAVDKTIATGLCTVLVGDDEIEIIAVAAEPGDDYTVGSLLAAVVGAAGDACKRIHIVCYNAELELQRSVQQSGFTLCAVRPGSVARYLSGLEPGRFPASIGGVPVRDEVEFELLMR